jgi:penicillin-binding protein 2
MVKIDKIKVVIGIIILVFLLLFLRLFQLQVLEGTKFQKLAEENAAKTIPSLAPRGIIYDRYGRILAENRPVFFVQIMPHLLDKDLKLKERVWSRLENLLKQKIDYQVSAVQPVIIKENIPLETVVRIEEQKEELKGVVVGSRPLRFYPFGTAASHLLGYVGEIEADELKRLKEKGYQLGDIVGKDGIEKYYEEELKGSNGGQKVEVDVYGKPVRLLESFDPIAGSDLKLTIDLDLQIAAEKALGNREGAVVILDPKTGEILALVSHPNYDPNRVWEALKHGRHPFMNRALTTYPPGSIFKVVTLTAALEEKLTHPGEVFYCPGYYLIGQRKARCWKESGHGHLTVEEGLVQSCDVVFYELGRRLGPERLARYARFYGLGERLGIDLPQEKRGLVPTEEWKRQVLREPWYEGDSINYGIGQGFLQVTPLQMAAVYGAVATGKRVKPFLVSEIRKHNGQVIYQVSSSKGEPLPFAKETLEVLRKALKAVVDRGTGIAARMTEVSVSGKTGTAQNPGLPHAWFLCYAPSEAPEIVIASFVAHGEHGDRAAAYVARDILKFYFDRKKEIW